MRDQPCDGLRIAPAGAADTPAAAPDGDDRPIAAARLAYGWPQHDQPTLAERKAMFLVAAGGLVLTTTGFFASSLTAVAHAGGPVTATALIGSASALVVLVLLAGGWAYRAYILRPPETPPTLASFRDVAARPLGDYAAAVAGLTHRAAVRDMLHYNYGVALLAAGKYRLVGRALAAMRVAIPLWMALLLVVATCG